MLPIIRKKKDLLFIPEKKFIRQIKRITGVTPSNLKFYQLALIHKSASGRFSKNHDINNERLEFLGDAILDAIVAEHIYNLFPDKDEGFLTQLRSKIVNRDTLKLLSVKMGIANMVIARMTKDNHKSLYGDALEAIIGAIYLDKGYPKTRNFVIGKIMNLHLNIEELCETEIDFKSRIIEWGQKTKKDINFTCQEQLNLLIFDEIVGMGIGKSKKEAEQNAARQAIQIIGIEANS